MKSALLLSAALLAACAAPEPPAATATLHEVVLDYQQHLANNVTFSEDVAGELRGRVVAPVDWSGLDAEQSDLRLAGLLSAAGLQVRSVGPEGARVVLIEAAAAR